MIKLPTGFKGKVRSFGSDFRAVVIEGQPEYIAFRGKETKNLEPGSYFGSSGKTEHKVFCQAGEECILYVRAEGKFDVVPV